MSPLAIILGYLALVVAGSFVGAYLWYRLVTWPRRVRQAREDGFAVVPGEKAPWDEARNPRPASFVGWLTGHESRS